MDYKNMNIGIYCIRNIISNKRYIGQSSNLETREYTHFSQLQNREHFNQYLQRAVNKYEITNFIFEVLIYCEANELKKYEQFFVDYFSDNSYNICKELVGTTFGIKYSNKVRKYLSKINSGKNNPMHGKNHSKKTKLKMRRAALGKNNSMYGKHPSKDTLVKMSLAQSGENNATNKLLYKEVVEIRDLYKRGVKVIEILKLYDIKKSQVYNIISGKSWKETK